MTFLAAAITRRTVWLLADRRLSTKQGDTFIPDSEDAVKLMSLQTFDGSCLVGYAGLGRTDMAQEPSEWISRALRGSNTPMRHKIHILAEAASRRLPQHLSDLESDHTFLIPAILDGNPRLFAITLERDDRHQYATRVTEYQREANTRDSLKPFLVLSGSGASTLSKSRQHWVLRQLASYDANQRTAAEIAFSLQWLNMCAYHALGERGSVGPRSIVMWNEANGGGNHRHFRGSSLDKDPTPTGIPMIMAGGDVKALAEIVLKFAPSIEDVMAGNFEIVRAANREAMEADVAKILCDPDDSLPKK